MSIDNPVDAALQVVKAEREGEIVGLSGLQKAVQFLPEPFAVIATNAIGVLRFNQVEQVEYLINVLANELKRIGVDVHRLSEEQKQHIDQDHEGLIQDAVLKASNVRGKERVEMLAKVLAHGIAANSDPDQTEDLMRIVTILEPFDVGLLREIRDSQIEILKKFDWVPLANQINERWRVWLENSRVNSRVMSSCAKLEGLGMLVSVERIQSIIGPNGKPYALLKKGADLLDYIQTSSDETPVSEAVKRISPRPPRAHVVELHGERSDVDRLLAELERGGTKVETRMLREVSANVWEFWVIGVSDGQLRSAVSAANIQLEIKSSGYSSGF